MSTCHIKIDNRVGKVYMGNPTGVNLKVFAAKVGYLTKVTSRASSRKTYFNDYEEITKEEFERLSATCEEAPTLDRVNQYLVGVPCVWTVWYFKK